ncbi:MAG: hypothetical protein A4E70_02447 [Syntrophus sp. PtaU1.Bin005]|nr:MAG: hypothetical protein A4E70_02447 [Syntrophus sp. PtaU1.Bin005]
MGTVHIGIGHDDDLVVADPADVVILLPDPRPQGRNHGLDFLVLKHLVEAGLLHIQDFSPQGQDSLVAAITPLLGGTSRRIPLHEINLASGRVPFLAVRQLSRQRPHLQGALPACQLAGPPGRFPSPRGIEAFAQQLLGCRGIFLQVGADFFVNDAFHEPPHFGVSQLGLGLAFKLGIGDLDADDAGKAFPQVLSPQRFLPFQEIVVDRIVVEDARQRRPESAQVRSPLRRVDAVGKGKDVFRVGVVVLQRHFHGAVLPRSGDKNRLFVKDLFVAVDVLDEGDDAPFVKEFAFPVRTVIDQGDEDAGVQEGQFPESVGEDVEIEFQLLKDLLIGLEINLGSPAGGLTGHGQRVLGHAADIGLRINLSVPADIEFQGAGKGVDDGDADPMKPAGNLVAVVGELSPGVQLGQNHLSG